MTARYDRKNYDSGSDYVLEYGELKFMFSELDFRQRVEYAAKKLKLIKNITLLEEDTVDLVNFCVEGKVREANSSLGYTIEKVRKQEVVDAMFGEKDDTLVHWLRRMTFRGAWLDQRVIEGELEPEFDEEDGDFIYKQVSNGLVVALNPGPSWEDRV
mgnify:CR=1 FL=1